MTFLTSKSYRRQETTAVLAAIIGISAIGLLPGEARANRAIAESLPDSSLSDTFHDPPNEVDSGRVGTILGADGRRNLTDYGRISGMTALDAMGVYVRTERLNVVYPQDDESPRLYTTGFAQASQDWDVVIEPAPNLGDTVFMQLDVSVLGSIGEFRFASDNIMDAAWTYHIQIDDQVQPVSLTPEFSTPITNLPGTRFEVPVGTPFSLRQNLTGQITVNETLLPAGTQFYNAFGTVDLTAAPRSVRFFNRVKGDGVNFVPTEANYTINGGPAPLMNSPPSQAEMLVDLTRRAIRGDLHLARVTGKDLVGVDQLNPLPFNLPLQTVSRVDIIMNDLRREEISTPLLEGVIAADEYFARQKRANEISALFQIAKGEPTYEEFVNDDLPGVDEILFISLLQILLGADPFHGLYTPDQPITLPLPDPATFSFSADSNSAGVSLRLPPLWGGGARTPEVLSSQVTVNLDGGAVELVNLTTDIASYEILGGQQTGVNHGFFPLGGQVWSDFNPATGEYTAYGEGLITNDLYPAERPIFVFQDIQGQLLNVGGETLVEAVADNEPMIVPGAPGEAPASQPVAYAATRARYDATTRRLHFMENTDASLAPDVSVVLTPEDVFGVSLDNSAEPLIGAEVHIDPLLLRSVQGEHEDVFFFDTAFEIRNDDGVFASGTFSLVRIDVTVMALIANVEFDDVANALASPFIEDWQSDPDRVMLLGRIGTLDLIADTEFFTQSGFSPTDFIAFTRRVQGIPEPATMSLLLALAVAAPAFRARLRRHDRAHANVDR